jgi:uncharacterized protein YijF (DUF1287 family)
MKHILATVFILFAGAFAWVNTPFQTRLVINGYLQNNLGMSLLSFAANAAQQPSTPEPTASPAQFTTSPWTASLIQAARSQIGVTTRYDGGYVGLSYPGGDIDRKTGVCTDVVIRALRDAHGIDLQVKVHEDMKRAFSSYPKNWGLSRTDKNIDHRRVPNLQTYLKRQGNARPVTTVAKDYQPGDIVTWTVSKTLPHIGIVSDRLNKAGTHPLVIHNIGAGTQEEDILFAFPITGHYRYK